MRIFVIRHAESRQNVKNSAVHPYDPRVAEYEARDYSLTEKGIEQADRAGRRLSGVKLDAIFCGPLHRHIATANEILKYQTELRTADILSDLTESDVCVYPGMPTELLCELFPDISIVRHSPSVTGGKACYSAAELGDRVSERKRAVRVMKYLRERFREGGNIAIIASVNFFGSTLGSVIMELSDEMVDRVTGFGCDNGSVSLFQDNEGHTEACFVNDVLHLNVPNAEMAAELPFAMQ